MQDAQINKEAGGQERQTRPGRDETRRDEAQGHGTRKRYAQSKQKNADRNGSGKTRHNRATRNELVKPTRLTNENESQNEFERANLETQTTIQILILQPSLFERQPNRPLHLHTHLNCPKKTPHCPLAPAPAPCPFVPCCCCTCAAVCCCCC